MNNEEDQEFLEFEALKEPWNTFRLADGTRLKLRMILQKVRLQPKEGKKRMANFAHNVMAVTEVPKRLLGEPDRMYPVEEIRANVIESDMGFEPEITGPSVYMLADGKIMVFRIQVQQVSRSSLFGPEGEPLYVFDYQAALNLVTSEMPTPEEPVP